MTILTPAPALLLAQAARDTLLVRPLPPVRTGFEELAFVAGGLTSILTLVLVALAIVALVAVRRAVSRAIERLDALLAEVRPLIAHATAASESLRQTSDLVHRDVSSAHEALQETGARVKASVGHLADRIDDFTDLLGKVHQHADAIVTIAGSAASGVAWGAQKLRARRRRRRDKDGEGTAADDGTPAPVPNDAGDAAGSTPASPRPRLKRR